MLRFITTHHDKICYRNKICIVTNFAPSRLIPTPLAFLTAIDDLEMLTGQVLSFSSLAGLSAPSLHHGSIPKRIRWSTLAFVNFGACSDLKSLDLSTNALNFTLKEISTSELLISASIRSQPPT